MNITFIKIFSILIVCASSILHAAEPSASMVNDTNDVLIGQQIKLDLKVSAEAGYRIFWPALADTLDGLDIIDISAIDTLRKDNQITQSRTLTVTSFDSGAKELSPIVFMYEKPDMDSPYPVQTDKIVLNFSTVQIDTSQGIYDIKVPKEALFPWSEYIVYIWIALAALLSILGFIFWLIKKKPKVKAEELGYDPKIPPHIFAMEALKYLNNEKLWQNGRVKLYHIKLTDILRTYITRSFDINATEMTSDELLDALSSNKFDLTLIGKTKKILEIADLAKFAKFEPLPNENSLSMTSAMDFVESTKYIVTAKEETLNKADDIEVGGTDG